jgi:para-nitrobenzyl esterase
MMDASRASVKLARHSLALIWLAASLLLAFGPADAQDFLDSGPDVLAQTEHGPVIGVQGQHAQVFRGIPYAAAPVGNLRFRRAVPTKPWAPRPRPARQRTPACPQVLDLDDPAEDGDAIMSEDCLTLNVWTPRADDKPRPVMVFIHGGALEEGSAANSWYDGAVLAARGDVVVVTIQYRLGALGFLGLEEIGGPAFAESGNIGLLDQIAALRWVQRNIRHFGGDAHNVTLFGESAGGSSIHALLAVPEAHDLFHKVIIESGTATLLSKRRGTEIAQAFMQMANVKTVAQLQRLSMEDVLRAQSKLFASAYGNAPFAFVEGDVLNRALLQRVREDPALAKPMLIGTNEEEMRYWAAMDADESENQPEDTLRQHLIEQFGSDAADLFTTYKSDSNSYQDAVIAVLTDVYFRIPSIRLAEINADHQPTYMYLFTYRSQTKGQTGMEYGAMHGLECAFVFHVDTTAGYLYVGPKGTWTHLSDQMVQAWTQFARSGDPNGPLLPHWPRYDSAQRATMAFGRHSDVILDPYGMERRAWMKVPTERFESNDAVSLTEAPVEHGQQ